VALPVELINPPVKTLPPVMLPVAENVPVVDNAFVVLLNVTAAAPPNTPLLLYCI
jgi:hypothetical protein